MPGRKPKTVSEYIAAAPKEARPHLRELRALLKKAAPKARETLKWGNPAFEEGRILFAYSAFKSHLNFMPTPSTIKAFKKDLAKYKTGMGTVQLPYDRPLPKALIRNLALYRVKELKERDVHWM
jgi:uncharacterized protein YdhG (YjbR/CyaY superfamily)